MDEPNPDPAGYSPDGQTGFCSAPTVSLQNEPMRARSPRLPRMRRLAHHGRNLMDDLPILRRARSPLMELSCDPHKRACYVSEVSPSIAILQVFAGGPSSCSAEPIEDLQPSIPSRKRANLFIRSRQSAQGGHGLRDPRQGDEGIQQPAGRPDQTARFAAVPVRTCTPNGEHAARVPRYREPSTQWPEWRRKIRRCRFTNSARAVSSQRRI